MILHGKYWLDNIIIKTYIYLIINYWIKKFSKKKKKKKKKKKNLKKKKKKKKKENKYI